MFSPIFATSARRRSSMLSPDGSFASPSPARLAGCEVRAQSATACAKARKPCSRATKSVSQLISTMAAVRASADLATTTTPSVASRAAFLSALACPCLRMSAAAASRSPLASTSAFLHSIMPAPVRSRSCLTASAVMFMDKLGSFHYSAEPPPAPPRPLRRAGAAVGRRATASGAGTVPAGATGSAASSTSRFSPAAGASGERCLLARVARLIELDELVFADRDLGHRLLALEHRIGDAGGIQLDGAHGIVVARDHVVDAIGRAVGVDDGHHRNAELLRLVKRDVLVAGVDHNQPIRERRHVLDAAETPLELVHLAPQLGGLFLATLLQRTGGGEFRDFPESLDGLADGLEVREHAAQPALVDERLRRALGLLLDRLARGALGADEQHLAAVGNHSLDEVRSFCVHRLRLLEVDDVDPVSLAEDEGSHLRVPEAGLMSEMDSRLQHLSHGHAGHERLLCGLSLRASP